VNEELPPLRERLGHTGTTDVVVTAIVAVVAPILSLFVAGSRVEDTIEWLSFAVTAFVTWLVISLATVVVATLWLWLGWESPDTDSMDGEEEP